MKLVQRDARARTEEAPLAPLIRKGLLLSQRLRGAGQTCCSVSGAAHGSVNGTGAVRASPTARVRLWGSRRQPPAARGASDVAFVCVHVLPAHGKRRFVCLSQAGSVKVLANGALPPRPCRALLSLGKDLASVVSFPLPAAWPSPSALARLPARALKAGAALPQPLQLLQVQTRVGLQRRLTATSEVPRVARRGLNKLNRELSALQYNRGSSAIHFALTKRSKSSSVCLDSQTRREGKAPWAAELSSLLPKLPARIGNLTVQSCLMGRGVRNHNKDAPVLKQ